MEFFLAYSIIKGHTEEFWHCGLVQSSPWISTWYQSQSLTFGGIKTKRNARAIKLPPFSSIWLSETSLKSLGMPKYVRLNALTFYVFVFDFNNLVPIFHSKHRVKCLPALEEHMKLNLLSLTSYSSSDIQWNCFLAFNELKTKH